ncbi:MAG: GDP-mannose 4,6-dehydratase [Streptococcaceae bacterium]|jgi:UDP-glucose 4-epimerase|nr:GDP-mannose 4,6-dehydratase [Streptococcaceae bacterium]
MANYLVTGGAGFIGSNLVNDLIKEHKVVVIDNCSMGKVENLDHSSNLKFIKGDVTDYTLMERILKNKNFDYIFHLAAIASVADSVERPVETHQVNFDSVFQLLERVRKYQPFLKRFVFSSSAAVYGDESTLPKQEESVIRPLTTYAIDKFSAEKFVLMYNNLYGVPTCVARFFNVYGPRQNPSSSYSGVISKCMDCFEKMKDNSNVKFTLFGDGKQSRDFVFVKDVIYALQIISEHPNSLGEVYNVGVGKATTLLELFSIIEGILGKNLPVSYEKARFGDIKESFADIAKLSALGYKPKYTMRKGMEEYILYFNQNSKKI